MPSEACRQYPKHCMCRKFSGQAPRIASRRHTVAESISSMRRSRSPNHLGSCWVLRAGEVSTRHAVAGKPSLIFPVLPFCIQRCKTVHIYSPAAPGPPLSNKVVPRLVLSKHSSPVPSVNPRTERAEQSTTLASHSRKRVFQKVQASSRTQTSKRHPWATCPCTCRKHWPWL